MRITIVADTCPCDFSCANPKMPTGAIGWINTMPKNTRSLTVSSRFRRGCSAAADVPFCDGDEVITDLATRLTQVRWQVASLQLRECVCRIALTTESTGQQQKWRRARRETI